MTDTAETTTEPHPGTHPVVDELLLRIAERVEPDRRAVVTEFARAYTRRIADEELAGIPAEELFGQVKGAFDLADARGSAPQAVRVFNPDLATDGYQTVGTVVETNTDDSPFLVDSVDEELSARGLATRRLLHPVIGASRGPDGRIERIVSAREAPHRESVMHFEVDRRLPDAEREDLATKVVEILRDVRLVVRDFDAMMERTRDMADIAREGAVRYSPREVGDTIEFIEWLLADNFVLLGYREYDLVDTPKGRALVAAENSGLGILSKVEGSGFAKPVLLSTIEPALRRRIEDGDLLIYSKTNRSATVHRRARMDYIGVRRVAPDGSLIGEARLIGLFTSKAYMEPASKTPLLSRKLEQVLLAEDLFEGSHDYKAAISLFESFPKDELFAASTEELRELVTGLLQVQKQQGIRVLVRRDLYGRSVSVVVGLPRDRFNAPLRKKLQALFLERFAGTTIDYHLSLGESEFAQIFFTVHVDHGQIPDVPYEELEAEVERLARTWDDDLQQALIAEVGEIRGITLARTWGPRFPDYYRSNSDWDLIVADVLRLEALESSEEGFVVGLGNERSGERLTRVALYKTGGKIDLSAFMPILESLGLRVVEEVPTGLLGDGKIYIHDFGVLDSRGGVLDLAESADRVAETVAAVWRGETESDSLHRLVISGGLTWREVAILRAYRTYGQRVAPSFTEAYLNDALAANPGIAAKLVRLFEARFDPAAPLTEEEITEDRRGILLDLRDVTSLDQDRIVRTFLGAINATVRTNAFLPDRRYLSIKLRSAEVPDMPKPFPLYEIFVYSPEMEAIHLRGGRVARGGIRWSDRKEDYRTEVLGLMKAQKVKNAVIVPDGSKGGFVLKRTPSTGDLRREVSEQYVSMMRGLLDITDNRVDGQVVHPEGVRVRDEEDPYLVVAADKGTATFSDTANAVAAEYGFWLGDAFASGGSAGYDHKKLAITARGAWESVKRHFREMGIDTQTDPIRVVGIGDMSGDVFGNGMLLSPTLRLVGAFDHRHVFIDPDPDPAVGLEQRRRLFFLAGSSWGDYDTSTLSAGGGVYDRRAKSITLSPEARAALGVADDAPEEMPPNEVIRAILKAPVDLLWNGGVGTYVKHSKETNADVGDRTNDNVRISGNQVRTRVVGEGGNLGFTQRGRIEFAMGGGRINTDFIDNSGGVDCSDHEVNLKILLNLAISRGELTLETRNEILEACAADVVEHVLYTNYLQAQILSQELLVSASRIESYEDLMQQLEGEGELDREVEFLPSADEMAERRAAGAGMVRPELAVLLAYAKRSLATSLLRSDLPESEYLERDIRRYFPPLVVERFGDLLPEHPLRRELNATILANDVVNSQGVTFVTRLMTETGAQAADVVRAFRIARDVTGAVARWADVESLDGLIDPVVQNELMTGVDWLVETTSRWWLVQEAGARIGTTVEDASGAFAELTAAIDRVGSDSWREEHEQHVRRLMEEGVPQAIARRHAFQSELVHGPDIISVARESGRPVEEVARIFFLLGERLEIDWLEFRLEEMQVATKWQRWAVQSMEDDVFLVRRQLAERLIDEAAGLPVEEAVGAFLERRAERVARLERFMRTLKTESATDLAQLTVGLRQIRSLIG